MLVGFVNEYADLLKPLLPGVVELVEELVFFLPVSVTDFEVDLLPAYQEMPHTKAKRIRTITAILKDFLDTIPVYQAADLLY